MGERPRIERRAVWLSFSGVAEDIAVPIAIADVKPLALYVSSTPTVYFLCNFGEVVYVGYTTELSGRLRAHKPNIHFDRVFYFTTETIEGALALEGHFIRKLKPVHNTKIPRKNDYTSECLTALRCASSPPSAALASSLRRPRGAGKGKR